MLTRLAAGIVRCRRCPRLIEHCQQVARERVARFRGVTYWGRPVPGFGDPQARLLVVGLAPAAHGANRTGRMFTGDRSGEWLYAAMHRAGFANQPRSTDRRDGLVLRDAWVTAVVRCAPPGNKPARDEMLACQGHLVHELAALPRVEVVVALGKIAHDGFLAALSAAGQPVPRPRPRFAHGSGSRLPSGQWLLASYHPSQQNTFTRRLTVAMLDDVFDASRRVLDHGQP